MPARAIQVQFHHDAQLRLRCPYRQFNHRRDHGPVYELGNVTVQDESHMFSSLDCFYSPIKIRHSANFGKSLMYASLRFTIMEKGKKNQTEIEQAWTPMS